MATKIGTSVKNFTYTGGATHTATRDITAGDAVVACVSWENVETLSSVTDSAGGTWVVATQQAHPGTPAMPIGAIAYCLSHPGGTGVVVTANFSGSASAILSMNLLCFRPGAGTSFAYDDVATPGTGSGTSFTTGSSISTAAAGVVVQYVAGYQFASGVTAGGTPTFTRDTDTESGSATDFAQYLLSGSAQTVTPGASWGALGNEWVMLALALKEVAGGSAPTIDTQPEGASAGVGGTAQFAISATGATSYQWQVSSDGGETWANVAGGSGGTTSTYTTPTAAAGDNGLQYRCRATNTTGTTDSVGAWFFVSGLASDGKGRRLALSALWQRARRRLGDINGHGSHLLRSMPSRGPSADNLDLNAAWRAFFFEPTPPPPPPPPASFPPINPSVRFAALLRF